MTTEQLLEKAEALTSVHKRTVLPVSLSDGEYAFMFTPDHHTQIKIIDSLRAGNSAMVCDTALENLVIVSESSANVLNTNVSKYRLALGRVLLSQVETVDAEIIKKK